MLRPEALRVLGNLPRLRRLTFRADSPETLRLPQDLPDSAFPVLEHLALRFFGSDAIEQLLCVLPLVQNVTSLEVATSIKYEVRHGDETGGTAVNGMLRHLKKLPRLASLHADFGNTDYDPFGPRDISVPSICNILSGLPLRVVNLRGLIFGNTAVLGSTFPLLTKLVLPNQPGPMSLISEYASIPALEHLVLLMTADVETSTRTDTATFQSLHTLEFVITDQAIGRSNPRQLITEHWREAFPRLRRVAFLG
ncbi:hypothetical protein BDV93DRAFT_557866 [Ceratobasidium sp. AG-I]|nr:hypothetical protein BDV93DRAFT_557866 [Ceratobasidium sp. AG-I]